MLTGERRGVRRGMTVLGKIPAVPKPINLPSQRLENRGLDPNVELVPRGTVTWGNSARSPPTTSSPWGSSSQPSSPPVSAGAWGNTSSKPAPAAWGPNSTRPSSAGSTRPTSAGGTRPLSSGGPRPSSAGSRHLQDLPRPSSAGTREIPHTQNAWASLNSRPSSASGLGQPNSQPAETRPRSAESRSTSRVSLLSSELSTAVQPWGPGARKLPEELPQPSRFTLTTGDFPTLGSEKNPSLRPQQRDRSGHPDDRSLTHEERPPPPSSAGTYQDDPYSQGSRLHDGDTGNGWGRDPFRGQPGMIERDANYCMPSASSNSWRREGPHDLPDTDDHWRGPPGPYGPAGPPRFPNPEFVHQRFGPGPGSYGRGGHGQPGDGYGGPSPFMRPMTPDRPGHHFGPGMFPGPYDGYYGYPGPNYNMEDREMMMWGGPGRYGGFQPGPPEFSRHPHGGMGPRPRQMPGHTGFGKDSEGFHADHRDAGKLKEGENAGARTDVHAEFRRLQNGEPINKHVVNEPKRHMYGRPYGQRDWGNEEPMDFSKPVFEKEPSNNSSSKNHKVTFKAEPSVADVAILKKPQTIKAKIEDQDQGGVGMDHLDHAEGKSEESNKGEEVRAVSHESIDKDKASTRVDDAKDLGKLVEEKSLPDMSAGVLGKAPPTALGNGEMQGSSAPSHVNNALKGLGDVVKQATEHVAIADPHEQPLKEGFKSKFKPVVHELEKEWRPKVQIADSKVMASKPSHSELPSPLLSAQESGDFENAADVYDYEAQRAKMKEIAAQRARQLQKEEEERTKEQKAKALAKLEELNRKSAAISSDVLAPSTPGETEEVPGNKASNDQLVQSDEVQSGTNVQEVKTFAGPPSTSSTKAEHGKRSDRKGNSRNREERSKSHQRKEPTMKNQDSAGENRTEPPLLPSPGVCHTQQQQEEESRTAKPDVPQAPQTQQKQPRQRGKQHVLTAKGPEDVKPESPVAREQVESFSSMDTAAIDSDSAEIRAVNTFVEPTTGNGPRRKKSNRGGKNRQKTEAGLSAASGLEKSSSGELHEESSLIQPVGVKTLEKVATGMSSHSEGGESITIEPADPAESVTIPEDRSSSRGNGERLSRKYQRKFQASKRTSKPQDVRVSDKAHAGEGMVWAPVRPNSGGMKNESGPELNEEKKHGSGSQQPTKSRRAEIERYTPKPVIKQQPQHAEKVHEENHDFSHEKHARAVEGQGPEAYHKPGRGHVSWRQRSGSDRGAKDASESNENRPPVNGSSKGLQQQRHEPEKFTEEQQSPKSATVSGVAEKVASQAPTGRPNRSYPRQDHRYSNSPGMRKFDRSEDALPQNSGRLFSSEGSRNKSGKQQQGLHWQPNDLQTQHDAGVSRSPNGPGRRQHQTDESGPPEILHAPVFRSHDKERQRENGMVYQQKSGSRQSQDIFQHEKVSENHHHQKFPHQQGGPGYVQKTSATDMHKSQAQYQPVSQHPKSQGNSESWSSKADHSSAHWGGDVKDGRSREAGHSRRGRFGGRGGMRSVDLGNRVEKQRMVIDATGGAVPSQVVG